MPYPLILNSLLTGSHWWSDNRNDDEKTKQRQEKVAKRFTDAVAKSEEFLAAGSIPNPWYKDLKTKINSALEDFYNDFREKYFNVGKWEEMPREVYDFLEKNAYHPQLHTLIGCAKRLNACKLKHPAIEDMKAFVNEALPLANMFAELKGMIRKGREPKENPADVKAKYIAPRASGTAAAKVLEMLTQVVEESYAGLLSYIENHYLLLLKRHAHVVSAFVPTPMRPHFSLLKAYENNAEAYFLLRDTVNPRDPTKLLPNAKELALAKAKQEADNIRTDFLYKNLKKIDSIVEAKNNFLQGSVVNKSVDMASLSGTFFFEFSDGSSFYCQNSVVISYSKYNKRFARFPLRFMDVKMPGGVKMPSPSEERMKTVFVKVV